MSKRFWLAVLYVATIGLMSNFVALFIKRDKLQEDRFPFKPYAWERNGRVYDKLAIRKWKNHVPDVSRVFKPLMPKRVTAATTVRDLISLIKECCVAELIHIALMILSAAVLFICPGLEGLILYFLCILINLPFVLIQRYNRPQLKITVRRLEAREERKKKCVS